jgi:undecaprenyl diphosphate synthase
MDFSKEKLLLLDRKNIPKHIAIMMDGNRRWAKLNKLNYVNGHRKGASNLKKILKAASYLGVRILTVYAFSTENRNRSKKEIDALMNLFESYLKKYGNSLKRENVRLRVIGDVSICPLGLKKNLKKVEMDTIKNDKIDLVLAINYGGRDEITRAVKKIVEDFDKKRLVKEDIKEKLISKYLDTFFCPDPDLLIRTSGEYRLSNFLLWQMSYTEIFVVNTFWPEFSKDHLLDVILEYQKRDRRFGGL